MSSVLRSILALTIGAVIASAPLPARQEPEEKPKPEQPKKKQEPQPQPKPKEEQQPSQEPAPPPKQKKEEKKEKEQSKETSRQHREQDKRSQANMQKEAGRGAKIPQQKFQASFGPTHHFHVTRSGGGDNRRFQNGGYVFEVVEVWPVGWSFDDECYIEEDGDDYYLVDVVHPEIRVIVIVISG